MKIIASNKKMMPHLFLAFVIFILAFIALRNKNNLMSRILSHFTLINMFLTVKGRGPECSFELTRSLPIQVNSQYLK
jgi:hypothetical protein